MFDAAGRSRGWTPTSDQRGLPADVDEEVLRAGGDLDTLARLVLRALGDGPAGTAVFITTLQSRGDHLRVEAWAFPDGFDPGPPPPDPLNLAGFATGRALTEGVVMVPVPDGAALAERMEPGFRQLMRDRPIAQLLSVAVVAGDDPIGTLTATRVAGQPAFTDDDASLLRAIADRIGVPVDHARLLSAVGRAQRRQVALTRIGEQALQCATTRSLYDLVARQVRAALQGEMAAVLDVEPESATAVIRAVDGLDEDLIDTFRLPTTGTAIGRVLNGDPVAHVVVVGDPGQPGDSGVRERLGIEAALVVGLRHRNRVVALLGVGRTRREAFSAGDEQFLVAVATLMSTVLDVRATQERLRSQALSDELTGLPNRTLMAVRIQEAMARADANQTPTALLLADLDGFKVLNDSLGHEAGDHVLRVVAARLSAIVRPGDMVARLGGDEFAVLCHGLDEAGATAVARRMLEALGQTVNVEGTHVVPRASVGITVYDPTLGDIGRAADDLLPQADMAMYRAKSRGHERIAVYDVAMHEEVQRRLHLEQGLRAAIGTDQLHLVYQPVVRLGPGAPHIRSLEALVRWQHPTLGMVRPDQFIHVAEESGLICDLDTWVLGEAARQVVRWREAGIMDDRVQVAVNMSSRDLTDPGFVDRFTRVLHEARCPASQLFVEVTETLLTDAVGAETVRRLKELGVQIALDDYGTGFSSLGQLKRVPIDVLKIDRSFVANLLTDPVDATIVTSTIALAHALGKRVVAEGIETVDQLQRLMELGCDAGQGFLLARPQPVDVVTDYLAEGIPDLLDHFAPAGYRSK